MKTLLLTALGILAATSVGRAVDLSSVPCPPGGAPDPRTDEYRIDDGTGEESIGLGSGGTLIWFNQFQVTAGSECISSISVAWGYVSAGNSAEVLIFVDPNNDGNPRDAILAWSMPVTSEGGNTNTFFTYPTPGIPVGSEGDFFYVGVCCEHGAGEYPARLDQTSSMSRSWAGGDSSQGWSCENPSSGSFGLDLIDDFGYPGNWMIRASSGTGCDSPRGACCLDNGQCLLSYAWGCPGEFMGNWISCDPSPCPVPAVGACCGPEGECALTIEAECLSGDWRIDATCDPNPCPHIPPFEDCLRYQDYPHWVGSVELRGQAMDVALTPNLALVAEGIDGVQVLDVTSPDAARILGTVDTPGWALGVAVSGGKGYVADSTGLRVIDLAQSTSSHPQIIGTLDLGTFAHSVAASGTYAYVVGGPFFGVVDVSDPHNPALADYVWLDGPCLDVAVAGSLAYVAGRGGLSVIDVSNPMEVALIGAVATPSPARGLALQWNLVCLAAQESGLQVIDITDPRHPIIIGSAETELPAVNVTIVGGVAHVTVGTNNDAALEMFDLVDPAAPRRVNRTAIPGHKPWGIAATGSLLAYTYGNHYWSGGAIYFMDVTSTRGVPLLGNLELPGRSFVKLCIEGEVGYAITRPWAQGYASGLQLLDLSNAPSSIELLGSLSTSAGDLEVSGQFAYISSISPYPQEQLYVSVIDVSDPRFPSPRGAVMIGGQDASPMAISGRYLYIASTYRGLVVIDISDPDAPAIVGELDLHLVAGLELSGSYLYLAGEQSLAIVDLSSPSNPVLAATVGLKAYAGGLTVAGSLAYVHQYESHGPDEVQIVDVADPRTPVLRGRFTVPMSNGRMCVASRLLYMSAGGLFVADVADPDRPAVVGGAIRDQLASVSVADGLIFAGSTDLLVMSLQCDPTAGTREGVAGPRNLDLRVRPNPAQGKMMLSCIVPTAGQACAAIFDLSGRHVRTIFEGTWEAGAHDLVWDGRDARGHSVPAGLYLARLSTDRASRSVRIVILR